MTVLDKNGDLLVCGSNVSFGPGQGRYRRYVDDTMCDEEHPECGHIEVKTTEDLLKFPVFCPDGRSVFCPDVEVVVEKIVEVLGRFPNGHPRKVSVRDSRAVSAVVAVRAGSTWEPLHAVLPDGEVRDLPQCYALSRECLCALESVS